MLSFKSMEKIEKTLSEFCNDNPEIYFFAEEFPFDIMKRLVPFLKENLNKEEIELFIKQMSADISVDVDGFNVDFIKAIIDHPEILTYISGGNSEVK